MNEIDILTDETYNSGQKISIFLEKYGLAAQKKFGQNFLINPGARKKINDALELPAGGTVWEIGPGLGAQTCALLAGGAYVTAFEIDKGFCALLNGMFAARCKQRWHLVEGDVLQTWKTARPSGESGDIYLLGNLPYNIAGTVIAGFIENGVFFKRAVITVQKELGIRLLAKRGDPSYSALSALCQALYRTSRVALLGPANFYPAPNVDSVALRLDLKTEVDDAVFLPGFFQFQRAMFAKRRKTIKNNLEAYLALKKPSGNAAALLQNAALSAGLRAETMTLEDFIRLYKAFLVISAA
ncbi:MAG: 16S rRNA (adenine(1518)-N(6)/adenine(1519)-N(6))-dimethyltransferase RsmA [Spirochaetaceae bacterium]|jgi:16S rRNA (adenine1518-N6/adenine1519-N6)-dimethyltransferase|nr:16S rRNA (adenine(1518)-N(6)/adenine(1519)-N(6))-dimethyltransferase RsmA [Spirochaetaceae bacterium]